MTHIIRIGSRYYSARRGYCGGLTDRANATRFTERDAIRTAQDICGATVVGA